MILQSCIIRANFYARGDLLELCDVHCRCGHRRHLFVNLLLVYTLEGTVLMLCQKVNLYKIKDKFQTGS